MPLPSAIHKGNRGCRIKTLIAILPCQSELSYISGAVRRASERALAPASWPGSGSAIAVGLARAPAATVPGSACGPGAVPRRFPPPLLWFPPQLP